jgi:hypothetical protein
MFSKNIKEFLSKRKNKSIFVRLLLWYYRIFGITFGGLTITKTNECKINQNLKRFGFITTILIIIVMNILQFDYNKDNPRNKIYSHGFKMISYFLWIVKHMTKILFAFNYCYIQFRGFGLFTILLKYPIRRMRSKIVITSLFVAILLLQLPAFCVFLVATEERLSLKYVSFLIFTIIYHSLALISMNFMTWGKKSYPKILFKNNLKHFFSYFSINE